MRRTAFIDTMILVWWIRQEASAGQEEMIKRAQWLMTNLEEEKTDIMVSTVTVAEFLRGSPKHQQQAQASIIEETFICMPFDKRSAYMAAEHFEKIRSLREYEKRKTVLKADQMIAATALANRADVLYSHDEPLRRLAGRMGLKAADLPDTPPSLFDQ